MDMDHSVIEAEQGDKRAADLTRIEPATFRGVDCAVLAERYAAYLRGKQAEEAEDSLDVIRTSPVPGTGSV